MGATAFTTAILLSFPSLCAAVESTGIDAWFELQTHGPWAASGLLVAGAVVGLRRIRRNRAAEATARIDALFRLSPVDFVHALAESFRLQGYVVEDCPAPDGRLGFLLRKGHRTILVHSSHDSKEPVGTEAVRSLRDAMAGKQASGGLILTATSFSDEARQLSRDHSIGLIEGRALLELVNRGRVPAAKQARHRVRREPRLGLANDDLPDCPDCGQRMVRVPKAQGSEAPIDVWGCAEPECSEREASVTG